MPKQWFASQSDVRLSWNPTRWSRVNIGCPHSGTLCHSGPNTKLLLIQTYVILQMSGYHIVYLMWLKYRYGSYTLSEETSHSTVSKPSKPATQLHKESSLRWRYTVGWDVSFATEKAFTKCLRSVFKTLSFCMPISVTRLCITPSKQL